MQNIVAGMTLLDFCVQTPEHLKTETAEESFNPDGLAQRSIKLLKDTFPDIEVRDPYTHLWQAQAHQTESVRLHWSSFKTKP